VVIGPQLSYCPSRATNGQKCAATVSDVLSAFGIIQAYDSVFISSVLQAAVWSSAPFGPNATLTSFNRHDVNVFRPAKRSTPDLLTRATVCSHSGNSENSWVMANCRTNCPVHAHAFTVRQDKITKPSARSQLLALDFVAAALPGGRFIPRL